MEKDTTTSQTYQQIQPSDMERMSPGKFIANALVGYSNPLNKKERIKSKFAVYDGIAFSNTIIDGEDVWVVATYPLVNFINNQAKPMKEKIKTALNITEDRNVTAVEILQAYGRMTVVQ